MEIQRKKQYAEQRQIAKAKNQEHRNRMSERRKLEEDERMIKRKVQYEARMSLEYTLTLYPIHRRIT